MKRGLLFSIIIGFMLALLCPGICLADADKKVLNNGKKWRIGYIEGGYYASYPVNIKALVLGLSELGWIKQIKFPSHGGKLDTSRLWTWVASNAKSEFIDFVGDAYWSCKWDKKLRKKIKTDVLDRLNGKKDIDLMLAMGDWGGQILANNDHSVPTIVIASSNPVRSGIIKNYNDSGYDHITARVDPTRYERQIRIFYDVIKFKKLGLVYELNTSAGESYGAIEDVEKVAKDKGFEIIACHSPFSNVSEEDARSAVMTCHREIAPDVDAFYITSHRGVTLEDLPKLLIPFYTHKVPTFSQAGSHEVKAGVLMSLAKSGNRYAGRFYAENIAKIFRGVKPRSLRQVFKDPSIIAINLETAQNIGYDPPIAILGAADEIYGKPE